MRRRLYYPAALAWLTLLAACSVVPQRGAPPIQRDLGPPPPLVDVAKVDPQRRLPAVGTVSAAPWLDSTEIYYRLLYGERTRVRNYAFNRWIAPPAEMLQARLRQLFVDQGAATNAPQLDLRLIRFEQVFDTPERARAIVEVAASLHAGSKVLAQGMFEIEQPCAPSVDGAVSGLAQASAKVLAHERDWAAMELSTLHGPEHPAPFAAASP